MGTKDYILKRPINELGYNFIEQKYIPKGKDEYYLRNENFIGKRKYRKLKAGEIEVLVKNDNTSDDWNQIHVSQQFNPRLIKGCHFYGMIRIGVLESILLEFHDLKLPVGLRNSTIISTDIGDNVVIDNVNYLSHYQIGDESILANINEMSTSNYAKFGNGILKEDEPESLRIWMEICNENSGRKILPFDKMLASDAYLWSKYRDDQALMDRFMEITQNAFDKKHGYYGKVGNQSVIKNCAIIKDVKIGDSAYIKGANKLKNLTIKSKKEAVTQIGEGVEMVNGIVGYGCRIFYGVKAVRFVLGEKAVLKYGARLINSFLGENSTISCCEVLSSLIFAAHEQHHNTSFLCASTVLGQSNMAAGATIGSNHNSRANDGEIIAGRGFWPGLNVSLKHNCKFASFNLIAKGSYATELNVPFPFALISNNENNGCLDIVPAYWFLYNMYAIVRNSKKHIARDNRIIRALDFEFNFLAPDTVEEIFTSLELLEEFVGVAYFNEKNEDLPDLKELRSKGKDLLENNSEVVNKLEIKGTNIEASNRPVKLHKVLTSYQIYKEMIVLYGVKTIVSHCKSSGKTLTSFFSEITSGPDREEWINLGCQLVTKKRVNSLKTKIISKEIDSWSEIHLFYKNEANEYPSNKVTHAVASLLSVLEISLDQLQVMKEWNKIAENAKDTFHKIALLAKKSREKDYDNPFRKITFDSDKEMEQVMGKISENPTIESIKEEARLFEHDLKAINSQNNKKSKELNSQI